MKDDIIKLAQEAGFRVDDADFVYPKSGRVGIQLELERFAALVRADEREACAKVADKSIGATRKEIAAAIRARGEA
jgi:hypothetical protein